MKNIFRYERKFIINNLTIPELENLLRNSSFKFKKNFSERIVNSIYFDNHNKNSILEKKKSLILIIKSYFKLKILKK